MSAMWDNDEDTAELVEEVLPDITQALAYPGHPNSPDLMKRAHDRIIDVYTADSIGPYSANTDDPQRFRADCQLAAEVFWQAMIGTAVHNNSTHP